MAARVWELDPFPLVRSYVDGLVLLMRMTKVFIQSECRLQAWLVSFRSDFLKDRSTIEEIFYCFLIIHFLYIYNVYKQKEAIPTPASANDEIASNLLFV